jgi:signal transduction histidine kinase
VNRCRSRSFQEIVGISDELLPDFAGMILGQSSCQASGFDRSSETQTVVQRNLKPFHDLIAHAGFTPLLAEIAVIHDPRLQTAPRQTQSWTQVATDISTFFVSDIASYSSTSPGTLLRAWDGAIERLLEPGTCGTSRAVVPNSLTYTHADYSISLRPLVDDADRLTGSLGLQAFLGSRWPETGEAQRGDRLTQASASPSSSMLPTQHAASFAVRKRYQFGWANEGQDVGASIVALARGLVYYLMMWCADAAAEAGDEQYGALKEILRRSHLLVVPFRRPQMTGTESSITERQVRDRATFGGCLFALVGEQAAPAMDSELAALSIRLNWLLVRSALAEAYSGMALKSDKDYLLAVSTHHLPTELLTIEANIGVVSNYLSKSGAAGRPPQDILDKAGKALTLAQRLRRTAQMIRDGEKSVRHKRPERQFSTRRDLTAFDEELQAIVNEAWNQAFAPLHDKPEYIGVGLVYDGVACGRASEESIHAVWSDADYLRYVIAELLRNALIHGRFDTHKHVTVACRLLNGDADPMMSLAVLNPVSSEQMPKVQAFLNGGGGRIGLYTLERCALTFGVAIPSYKLTDGGLVEAHVVVARAVRTVAAGLKAVGASQ